jgi:glycosyltransferase involved in cell wall biosynthesis
VSNSLETHSSQPLVSVVIPVLNAARFLREALASVNAQTYPSLEIIVVDGPSTDETPHIAQSFPRVQYMQQMGVGMWNAVNQGIDAAWGEYIAMISSDDIWTPAKVQLQVEYLLNHPETDYVLGLTRFVLIEGETPPSAFRAELFRGERLAIVLEAMLARKALFERVGRFDESLKIASDVDWLARLANLNVTRGIIPRVLLQKRIHANNLSTAPSEGKTFQHEVLSAMRSQMQRQRSKNAQNE